MLARAILIALALVSSLISPALSAVDPSDVLVPWADDIAYDSVLASNREVFESAAGRLRRPGYASPYAAESRVTRDCCEVLERHTPAYDPLGQWLRLARARHAGADRPA